jgi:hypothetical protein
VVEAVGRAQDRAQRAQPWPGVHGEQRAHPDAEVGRTGRVQRPPLAVPEHVDAGRPGQPGRQAQLGRVGMPGHRRQAQEVVELGDAQRGRPFQQQVQQVGRGQHVVERPVGRSVG